MTFRLFLSLLFLHQSSAWVSLPSPTSQRNSLALQATSRQDFCKSAALAVVSAALAMPPSSALADATPGDKAMPNGVSYTVIKKGKGPKPDMGELVAIRFVAYNGGVNDLKIDDIFDTPEPYYTRVGSGALIKGVEEALPMMQLGDRWRLVIPGKLAFGAAGRPSSPGKPRIQPDATITFEVEMVGLPGKEPELIELIGDY